MSHYAAAHGQSVLVSSLYGMLQMCHVRMRGGIAIGHMLQAIFSAMAVSLLCLRGLDTVPALDDIRLQADRPRASVQLEEKSAGIAQHGAGFIAPPQRCRRGLAVGAYGRPGSILVAVARGRGGALAHGHGADGSVRSSAVSAMAHHRSRRIGRERCQCRQRNVVRPYSSAERGLPWMRARVRRRC